MTETFIPNTDEKYAVTDHGEIKNVSTGRILHGTPDANGYYKVKLYIPGVAPKYFYNHRLIADAFVPIPDKYDADSYERLTVRHINHNKSDNRPENLEWCEFSEAVMHAADGGCYADARMGRKGKEVFIIDSKGNSFPFAKMKDAAEWLVSATKRGTANSYRILITRYARLNKDLYGFKIIIK